MQTSSLTAFHDDIAVKASQVKSITRQKMRIVSHSLLFALCLMLNGIYNPGRANLLQLCEQIDHFKQFKWSTGCLEFADYGCFCGPGGWGEPVDEVDSCCMVHDKCYEIAMENLKFCYPYVRYYNHKRGTCLDKENTCDRISCECDRELARCLVFKKYHPKFINYRYLGHCKRDKNLYSTK